MFQPPSVKENEKEYIKQEIKGMTAWKQKELIELIVSTTVQWLWRHFRAVWVFCHNLRALDEQSENSKIPLYTWWTCFLGSPLLPCSSIMEQCF